jgi:hypothetical protein
MIHFEQLVAGFSTTGILSAFRCKWACVSMPGDMKAN